MRRWTCRRPWPAPDSTALPASPRSHSPRKGAGAAGRASRHSGASAFSTRANGPASEPSKTDRQASRNARDATSARGAMPSISAVPRTPVSRARSSGRNATDKACTGRAPSSRAAAAAAPPASGAARARTAPARPSPSQPSGPGAARLEDPGHHRQRRRRVVAETLGIGQRQRARVALHRAANTPEAGAQRGNSRRDEDEQDMARVGTSEERAVHTPDASARTARAGRRRARRFRSIPGLGPGTESALCAAAPRHCTAAPAFPPESRNRKTRIPEFTCPSSTSPSSAPASAAWPPRSPSARPA